MPFIEERLPTDIQPVMSGGARFATDIKMARSGVEFRNRRWAEPLREYSLSFSARDMDDVLAILQFAYKTAGAFHGFRMKDWIDYKSCPPNQTFAFDDQSLGTGDGSTTVFNMNKSYGPTYSRRIFKPVDGSVVVGIDGSETTQFTIDTTTGIITFNTAPSNGAALTWGGEFDVPVRFEEDILPMLTFYYQKGQTGTIGIKEHRIV